MEDPSLIESSATGRRSMPVLRGKGSSTSSKARLSIRSMAGRRRHYKAGRRPQIVRRSEIHGKERRQRQRGRPGHVCRQEREDHPARQVKEATIFRERSWPWSLLPQRVSWRLRVPWRRLQPEAAQLHWAAASPARPHAACRRQRRSHRPGQTTLELAMPVSPAPAALSSELRARRSQGGNAPGRDGNRLGPGPFGRRRFGRPGGDASFLDRQGADRAVGDVPGPLHDHLPARRGRSAATGFPFRLLRRVVIATEVRPT